MNYYPMLDHALLKIVMVTVDASIHYGQSEYQNGNPDKWKMNGKELENVNAYKCHQTLLREKCF